MLKLSLWLKLLAVCLAFTVAGCGGGAGSSAAPPSGFAATPGNGQVTLTWQAEAGVQYWLMYAATATPIDIKNPPGGHIWATNITSPYVLSGLTNGVTYSFAMNGRTGGGPGGAQTPSVSAMPHYAGSTWTTGTVMNASQDMRGIAYGTASDASVDFVAVGGAGAIYKGTDGANWSMVATGPSINFTGATYAFGKFIGVGNSGAGNNIFYSADMANWTAASTVVSSGLNAVASNGSTVVAVGNGGTVYYSSDAITWSTSTTTATSANLYGVAYSSNNATWVAVGAGGALITSTDLITWSAHGSTSSVDLNGVAVTSGNLFVAVGLGGKVVTSVDGSSWTTQSLGASSDLYAVSTDSTQFLAAGQGGMVYTSPSGTSWTGVNTGAGSTLYASIGSVSKYVVVGQAGKNASSTH